MDLRKFIRVTNKANEIKVSDVASQVSSLSQQMDGLTRRVDGLSSGMASLNAGMEQLLKSNGTGRRPKAIRPPDTEFFMNPPPPKEDAFDLVSRMSPLPSVPHSVLGSSVLDSLT